MDVALIGSPDDAQDAGDSPRHAEDEEDQADQELVAVDPVSLEDGHVRHGRAEVKGHEDRGDWHIDGDGRNTADGCCLRRIGRLPHLSRSISTTKTVAITYARSSGVDSAVSHFRLDISFLRELLCLHT